MNGSNAFTENTDLCTNTYLAFLFFFYLLAPKPAQMVHLNNSIRETANKVKSKTDQNKN